MLPVDLTAVLTGTLVVRRDCTGASLAPPDNGCSVAALQIAEHLCAFRSSVAKASRFLFGRGLVHQTPQLSLVARPRSVHKRHPLLALLTPLLHPVFGRAFSVSARLAAPLKDMELYGPSKFLGYRTAVVAQERACPAFMSSSF